MQSDTWNIVENNDLNYYPAHINYPSFIAEQLQENHFLSIQERLDVHVLCCLTPCRASVRKKGGREAMLGQGGLPETYRLN